MTAPQPFRFLDLPGEVRNVVYETLFPETLLVFEDGAPQPGTVPATWWNPNQNPLNNAAILATCRLINREAEFHLQQRIHVFYRGFFGPDRVRVANDVRRLVKRMTFDAYPTTAYVLAVGMASPKPIAGFTMRTLRPYHSLREVVLKGYEFNLVSTKPGGESVAELTALGGPRNVWLTQQIFSKLSNPPTLRGLWRTRHAVRYSTFQRVLQTPFVLGSRSQNDRVPHHHEM